MNSNYQKNIENILNISQEYLDDNIYSEFKNDIYSLIKENKNDTIIAKKLSGILGTYLGKEIEKEWHSEVFSEYIILLKKIYK